MLVRGRHELCEIFFRVAAREALEVCVTGECLAQSARVRARGRCSWAGGGWRAVAKVGSRQLCLFELELDARQLELLAEELFIRSGRTLGTERFCLLVGALGHGCASLQGARISRLGFHFQLFEFDFLEFQLVSYHLEFDQGGHWVGRI